MANLYRWKALGLLAAVLSVVGAAALLARQVHPGFGWLFGAGVGLGLWGQHRLKCPHCGESVLTAYRYEGPFDQRKKRLSFWVPDDCRTCGQSLLG